MASKIYQKLPKVIAEKDSQTSLIANFITKVISNNKHLRGYAIKKAIGQKELKSD